VGDVVNLRLARKRKDRAAKEQHGAENRAKFGRTKAEKQHTDLETARERASLDGAKIDDAEPTS
jgi:hypothetical protein